MRILLFLFLGLSSCSIQISKIVGPGPREWEQEWLKRDVSGRTKQEAEHNLFEWVRNYGARAGYSGPTVPIPDQVILPDGQLAWKRFDRVNQLKHSDLTAEALGKIEEKLRTYPDAVYSLRESDGAIAVFFSKNAVIDYLLF